MPTKLDGRFKELLVPEMHYMKSEFTSSNSKEKIALYHELGKPWKIYQ